MKAQELGFDVTRDTPELSEMLTRVKALEHQGFEFEAANGSLALLIRRTLKDAPTPFHVDAYHVSMRTDGARPSVCEATVKLRVGSEHPRCRPAFHCLPIHDSLTRTSCLPGGLIP